MKPKIFNLLVAAILLCLASRVQAVTCTAPVTTGFSTAYASAGVVPNSTSGGAVTFTCTRQGGDANPLNLRLRANNGFNLCGGTTNDASFGGSCITYELYKDSGCATIWSSNSNATSFTFSVTNATGVAQPFSFSWWGCITVANQLPAAGGPGPYTDSTNVQVRNGGTVVSSGPLAVSVNYPTVCSITSVGNVAFGTYVAFRNTALVAPTSNVVMNCTNLLPYTLALDATGGVVVGLNYQLVLSAVGTLRGTGPGQTFTIIGTMPANQAGTCTTGTCSGTNTHTLTVTY